MARSSDAIGASLKNAGWRRFQTRIGTDRDSVLEEMGLELLVPYFRLLIAWHGCWGSARSPLFAEISNSVEPIHALHVRSLNNAHAPRRSLVSVAGGAQGVRTLGPPRSGGRGVRRIGLEHRPSALASAFGSRQKMEKLSTTSAEPLYSAGSAPEAVDRTTNGGAARHRREDRNGKEALHHRARRTLPGP